MDMLSVYKFFKLQLLNWLPIEQGVSILKYDIKLLQYFLHEYDILNLVKYSLIDTSNKKLITS